MIVAIVVVAALASLAACLLLPHAALERGKGSRVRVPVPMHSCSSSKEVDPG